MIHDVCPEEMLRRSHDGDDRGDPVFYACIEGQAQTVYNLLQWGYTNVFDHKDGDGDENDCMTLVVASRLITWANRELLVGLMLQLPNVDRYVIQRAFSALKTVRTDDGKCEANQKARIMQLLLSKPVDVPPNYQKTYPDHPCFEELDGSIIISIIPSLVIC
eukprot:gb/GEZN01004125.1/.p1 GENE.gb/GEZN01004125.1/~~gb/GEZN01004125.1/.p1  ORF type:complete len:162 (-),score=7.97 gb/GEZN01004125.1/:550-1035(-)